MNKLSRTAAILATSSTSSVALAHEGHGSPDHHGHATDVGFVLVVVLVLGALALGRRK